jgi:hypothetical protein
MKVLILGAGQVGRTAAYHLSREPANEVTVIDTNEDTLRDLQDRMDVRAVAGNASYPNVLESAGIADTDILIALTSSDEVNMIACEIAYTLYRTPTKIARIRAAEYTSRAPLFTEGALAVDFWISPEQLAACSSSVCARAAMVCWWGANCARCASICRISRRASPRSIATTAWCGPPVTPPSRWTMRSSSSPPPMTCGA